MGNICKNWAINNLNTQTMKRILLAVLFLAEVCYGQQRITVDDFTTKNTFSTRFVSGIKWMHDGKYYTTLDDNRIVKNDITTGQAVETLLDGASLTPSVRIANYAFSDDEKKILLSTEFQGIYRRSYTARYFVYDLTTKAFRELAPGTRQSYATFSPDGSKVAFVRDNNLFYTDLANGQETQVTDDGRFNYVINGTTDWVYEEEFGFVIGFYWSPDSKKLAYYRFDESEVKEYNLQRWEGGRLYPVDYRYKYPKAGEANSDISIWFYDLTSGKKVKADIGTEKDIYIPRVKWTRDPNVLSICRMNRLQNTLEILHTHATTGASTVIYTEKSDTYVDIDGADEIRYLENGKQFIISSESNGYKHLYLYDMNGKLVRQITSGNYEVSLVGFDEKTGTVYYTSTEPSHLETHFYSIGINGKKKTKLSTQAGSHSINMSGDFQFYLDNFSSADQPLTTSLYQTKGNKLIKVLENNEQLVRRIKEYGLSPKEFFTFKTPEGTQLHGYMLKPLDFDASKQYPVVVYQYSGPGSQNVQNAWGGSHYYFHQLLVQNGYIVAVVDTRGTGARGARFKKMTYKQLGKYELEDLVHTAAYLRTLPYIDGKRLGIWGWSFGGYMSSLAMTKGAGSYNAAIAVAPVTNWRFYDNIYTERFLQTPQLNPEGYDQNSPTTYADKLEGKFLLIHGTGDDNVHFQNAVVFQEALINAGKQFESFYYPDKNHAIPGRNTRHHLYTLMLQFFLRNL